MEDATPEATLGQFGEEALDGVEPRAGGRGEVETKAQMAIEPGAHLGMLVSGVVVEDDVDGLAGRHLGIDGVKEADELLVTMALHVAADDGAVEHLGSFAFRRAVMVRQIASSYQGRSRVTRGAVINTGDQY